VRVVRWRDADYVGGAGNHVWRSQVGEVYLPEGADGGAETSSTADTKTTPSANASGDPTPPKPGAVGWERNTQGKLGARVADLGPMMDPER
jgi:ubiquitin-like modifier-activating enzyme ATG7